MKRRSLLLLLALCALPARALALSSIELVSPKRAKELGVTVTTKRSANDEAWVQVDFRNAGVMKGFRRADLELTRDGKRLVSTSMRPRKGEGDKLQLEFYGDPAMLSNASVTIFVYPERSAGGIGYQLLMKDFVPQPARR